VVRVVQICCVETVLVEDGLEESGPPCGCDVCNLNGVVDEGVADVGEEGDELVVKGFEGRVGGLWGGRA